MKKQGNQTRRKMTSSPSLIEGKQGKEDEKTQES
jgi:hypothetical protein